jgi:5-oxoprolinase (ATP-hydrolysing)
VLDRATLAAGTVISGPALVTDDGATTVIVPGWQATVLRQSELLLEPASANTLRSAVGSTVLIHPHESNVNNVETADEMPTPARLEIFNGLYMQVAEQMGLVLRDAARSVNVKERLDFSCAVFAADGSLVANAPHMPVHLGSMGASVRAVQTRLAERAQQAI